MATRHFAVGLAGVTLVVLGHFAIALYHGVAHVMTSVALLPWQTAYVGAVVLVLPLAGLIAALCGHLKSGGLVIGLSMLGSLVFGVVFHFILDNPDNVCRQTANFWGINFIVTAGLVALSEAAGTVYGCRLWRQTPA